jgi:hypothetical protein
MNGPRAAVPWLLLLASTLPASCTRRDKLPEGAVAIIDGVAITRREFELEKTQGIEAPAPGLSTAPLDRLIERALLATAARRRGIAPDSGFAASAAPTAPSGVDPALWRRRLEDSRLAAAYLKRIITDRVRICDADMTAWMRSHPAEFAGRTFEETRPWLMPLMAARQESAAVRAHVDRLRRRARIIPGPAGG